jgi:hypothetical protein
MIFRKARSYRGTGWVMRKTHNQRQRSATVVTPKMGKLSELGSAFLVALLIAQGTGCGRIPPLYDAAVLPPRDSAMPMDGRRDSSPAIPDVSCSGVVFSTATREPADVLLVLDRSGSMNYSIDKECSCDPLSNPNVVCADTSNCTTRWSSLVTALASTLSSTPLLHWGLKLFSSPGADSCQVTSGVEIPIAADTIAAIQARMTATTPAGDTPTEAAITAAATYLKSQTDTNSKMLLLATDGKPNCGGSPPSVYEDDVTGTAEAITAAADAGFLVYVIGIGMSTSATNLDAFAQAGRTGKHYPAQSSDELTQALVSISKGASCTFALTATPPDPNQVAVYLDKNMVPQDPSNGWSFGANPQIVLFHGTFCDRVLSELSDSVQVLFSCGEPLPPVLM